MNIKAFFFFFLLSKKFNFDKYSRILFLAGVEEELIYLLHDTIK